MNINHLRWGNIVFLFLLVLISNAVESKAAKRGWYVGGGVATQALSGGFEEGVCYSTEPGCTGTVIFPGQFDSGRGMAINAGFRFSQNFSLDFFKASTEHEAEHPALPNTVQKATLESSLLGPRIHFGIGTDALEFFLRGGYAMYGLEYDKATSTDGGKASKYALFSGSGWGYGVGLEIFFRKIGVELGYTRYNGNLDLLFADGSLDKIDPVDIQITTTNISVAYHFGN